MGPRRVCERGAGSAYPRRVSRFGRGCDHCADQICTLGKIHSQRAENQLCTVVEKLRGIPVVVLGDLVLDEFAYGEIARVSREAPVLILDYKESRYALGGGANAAANLTALGAQVRVVGRVGKDQAGEALLGLFEERGIDRRGIVRDPDYQTPVKTRILAGGAHTSKQQIVRLDRGRMDQRLPREIAGTLLGRFQRLAKKAAALLVTDYGFGAASPKLRHAARSASPDVVTLDSRFRVLEFPGITAATPMSRRSSRPSAFGS